MIKSVLFNPKQPLRRWLAGVPACIICLFMLFCPVAALAQKQPDFEETSVFLNVSGLGGEELEVLIKDEKAYLPVTDLFGYLKIKNQASPDLTLVTGFFLTQDNPYVIDQPGNRIILQNKTYALSPDDLAQTSTGLYLRSSVFGKVFGLNCIFNIRNLTLQLNTKVDLPAIRERRRGLMRSNIGKLKREIIADTTVGRTYPLFSFGTADWSATSTQQDRATPNTRLNLRLGAIVAYGETNVALNYDTRQDFKLNRQNYYWRYVNNDNRGLRQVIAGNIPVQSTSSLLAPVIGLQFTNAPTTFRRSFGTYTLSDVTEPEWVVELYINHVLVDYVKADASGFFTFQVPMVYGSAILQLRFFGPGGEEHMKEQNISIPYNFIPKNEMEYTLSAGILEDGKQTRFSRADLKYGVNNVLTVGSGAEYLSSANFGSVMPFINASFRAGANLFFSGDYTYDIRARAILNYRMPYNLLFELNYIRYKEGQQAIFQNALEERKAILSKSFLGHNFSGFSRLSVNQVTYPQTRQTIADMMFSGTWQRLSSNLTTSAIIMRGGYHSIYSNLSLACRVDNGYTLRPQLQYGYTNSSINSVKMDLEKVLYGIGFVDLTYDRNLSTHIQHLGLSAHFDLSFVRASFSAAQVNNGTVFTQSFNGGSIYNGKTNNLNLNNRSNVGRGGLLIYAYLDLNSNGRRDPREPKIAGLKLKLNGGRIQNNAKDTTIQVFDLEPYNSYLLELNPTSFDNIAWQLKNTTFKVTIDPNKIKLIEVPVRVSGEVSGTVYGCGSDSTGQGRIIVNFYRGTVLAGRTVTESDGYFSFLGLAPGLYTACVDTRQLGRLKMTALPASKPFSIAVSLDGVVVTNIRFKLTPLIVNK